MQSHRRAWGHGTMHGFTVSSYTSYTWRTEGWTIVVVEGDEKFDDYISTGEVVAVSAKKEELDNGLLSKTVEDEFDGGLHVKCNCSVHNQ